MDTLCAIFEEWYIGDGTYPLLKKGQKVNLSFYAELQEMYIHLTKDKYLRQQKDMTYDFCGEVVYRHPMDDYGQTIIVVDTGRMMFYIECYDEDDMYTPGTYVAGRGNLLVDYYIWVENLDEYPNNPPDIFYNFEIDGIRKVTVSEETQKELVEEVEVMEHNNATLCYFLDLRFITDAVPRTFIEI